MFSLAISDDDLRALKKNLFTKDGEENCALLIGGVSRPGDSISVLVREVIPVPAEAYRIRSAYHLEVAPAFINQVIDRTRGKPFSIVMVHSHPGSAKATYSPSDDHGESRLFKVFSQLIPEGPHASLLFTETDSAGRYWKNGKFKHIDRIRVSGGVIRNLYLNDEYAKGRRIANAQIFDRQVLAFGLAGHSSIAETRVAIVGTGGTGSCVAEQIVRLGVHDILLVDPDRFDASNLSRTYGTEFQQAKSKRPKVELVAHYLKRINPGVNIQLIKKSIVGQGALLELRGYDVIFACTDNDWSRSILNRFAYQYLTPVIDVGIRLVVESDKLVGAAGRVSLISPTLPCLWCSNHLNAERIRVESMPEEERMKLQREKYIQGFQTHAPAVISFNSTVASLAVTKFLDMVATFSDRSVRVADQMYDAMEGIVFRAHTQPDPKCDICSSNGLKGLGDLQVVSAYE